MKVETKIQMEKRLKNEARQRIKDRINEKMELQIQHFKNKNNTKYYNTINNYHTFNPQKNDNLQHDVFQHNHTNTSQRYLNNTKVEESNNKKKLFRLRSYVGSSYRQMDTKLEFL